jgi:hypothetical protein
MQSSYSLCGWFYVIKYSRTDPVKICSNKTAAPCYAQQLFGQTDRTNTLTIDTALCTAFVEGAVGSPAGFLSLRAWQRGTKGGGARLPQLSSGSCSLGLAPSLSLQPKAGSNRRSWRVYGNSPC